MSDKQNKQENSDQPKGMPKNPNQPKPESTSEYEGAQTRKPTGNTGTEVKTETSSSSGE